METERTIYSHEFMVGRGSVTHEFYKGEDGVWMSRKPNARDAKDREFKSERRTQWVNKYERIANPAPTLFSVPKEPRVTIKQLSAQVEELRSMVAPVAVTNDELAELEVNNETILRPDYIHPEIERILGGPLPSHRVFARPHIRGDRHYMYGRPNDDRNSARPWLIFPPLPGVTSIIKKTCPTPESLIKWMCSFPGGYQAAREYTDLMAAKGTIMHGVLADLVNGVVPELGTPEWHRYIEAKIRKQKVDLKYHREWEWFMRKTILSFLQWIEDYEVTIILMEIALVSETLGYAGQVDCFCEMNDKKYTKVDGEEPKKRKRVKAIVDFKSGENSHETHATQLGFYVPLFRESFPDCDLTGLQTWNWHPSDWQEDKMTFSYKFINQSLKLNQRRTDLLLGLYNLDAREEVPPVMQIRGVAQIGVKPADLVSSKPFTEHWEETFHLAMDLGLDL